MEDVKRKWGGRRDGAGRPSLGKVVISSYISPDAKQKLVEIAAEKKLSIAETLEMLIKEYR